MMKSKKLESLAHSVERIADSKKLNAIRYPCLMARQALNAKRSVIVQLLEAFRQVAMKHKVQSEKRKVKVQSLKLLVLSFSFAFFALSFVFTCYAKEITILYTGETHAMLYHCSCPIEPDGGATRRAALIKRLKKDYPEALVLDSGSFFAGGAKDEYTQNTQLDMRRSAVNLKAMELMGYDAVNIGDDEFNFGQDFFQENIAKTKLTFLSCNLKSDKLSSHIIKEISGIKVGIIGVTPAIVKQKAGGLQFTEPKIALKETIEETRKEGANFIIVLSNLNESEDQSLINDIKGIDILIAGYTAGSKEELLTKSADTFILRPTWQGRRLNKASFTVENNKIIGYKTEDLRLSDKIPGDEEILAALPHCFSDNNCKKEGFIGTCQDAGSLSSRCSFAQANKVNLLVITAKACAICEPKPMIDFLKKQFPGLVVSYLYYPDKKAKDLIGDFGISGLPAYFLGKEAEGEKNFDGLKNNLEFKGNYYMLKPLFSGVSYFFDRKKIKGKLDLILSLYDKNTPELLGLIKEFNPNIHFLAIEQKDKFDAISGNLEIEECLRGVCVQKYYPQSFWDYISCRAKNTNTGWWEDCAAALNTDKIKLCAKTEEGSQLLRENIALNKELQIMAGPTYLLDNQEIFATKGMPTKEELRKIIKKE